MKRRALVSVVVVLGTLSACTTSHPAGVVATTSTSTSPATPAPSSTQAPSSTPPRLPSSTGTRSPGHVVVVMMENHSYSDVIGFAGAPFINQLAARGADLTAMYAITHPSQPNYVALLSGSTLGVTDDVCPQTLSGANLAGEAIAAGIGFTAYSEGLPNTGNETCADGRYARKHAPWTDFATVPGTASQPFTAFPSDYTRLPAVAFVVPNLDHDMHDGSIAEGDAWVRANLSSYVSWAAAHDSQLVVTWDEDDRSADNHIPTIIVGAGVTPQVIATRLTLYSLLRYLEDRFGLVHLGAAATATPIPLPA